MTKLLTWDTALTLLPTWILNMLKRKLTRTQHHNITWHFSYFFLMTWALRAADIWEFKTIILFEAIFQYYNPLAIVLSYFAEHCVIWRGVWVRQFFRFFAAVAVWGLTGCVWGQAGTSPTDRTVSPPSVELSTNIREVSQWPDRASTKVPTVNWRSNTVCVKFGHFSAKIITMGSLVGKAS